MLACKAVVAMLLAAAGGAKLADLPSFAATVALFWPARPAGPMAAGRAAARAAGPARPAMAAAAVLAGGEVAAGAASLSSPRSGWVSLAVLVICAGFVGASVIGYARYPGRPCRCFGALTARSFSVAGIGRAAAIAAGAAAALVPVRPALVQLGAAGRLGLAAGALLVAAAAYSAAAAAAAGRGEAPGGARPGWA